MWRALTLTVSIALGPAFLILFLNPESDRADFALSSGDQRFCNTVLNPPGGIEIYPVPDYESTGSAHLVKGIYIETVPHYEDNSLALLDPVNGEAIRITAGSEDAALLDAVLATKRVTPINSLTATWPYSERTLVPPQRDNFGVIHYRAPDPGAGLTLIVGLADGHEPYTDFIVLANCRSEMGVNTATADDGTVVPEVFQSDIHREDREAFRRFLEEVEIRGSPTE